MVLKLVGTGHCWYTDKDGNKVHETEKHNAIVTVGFDFVRQCLTNSANRPSVLGYVAIGSGSTATSIEMTELESESARIAGTWEYDEDGKTFKVTATFPAGSVTGNDIQEAGVFNASSGGIMFDRLVYDRSIPVLLDLDFTQEITFELA